jgi:hypothetical protein
LKPLLDAQERAAVQLSYINLRQNDANKAKSNEELMAQSIESVLNAGAAGGSTVTYNASKNAYAIKKGGKTTYYGGGTPSVDGGGNTRPTSPPAQVPAENNYAGGWYEDPDNPNWYWLLDEGDKWKNQVLPKTRMKNKQKRGWHDYAGGAWGDTLYKAAGGYIMGPGSGISDSIPAMLSNGEFVVKASSVAKYGTPMLDAINKGHYAMGGYAVPMAKYADGGLAGSNATINAVFNISGPDAGQVADQAIKKLELMMKKNGAVTRI